MTILLTTCPGHAAESLDPWAERYVGQMVRDVAYGAGTFVAVGDAFYQSSDGVCWSQRPLETPSINGLSGVAYGNGRFVTVESGAWRRESRVFTSINGASWQTTATLPASDLPVIDRVFFGNGTFLAVGEEANPSSAPGFHWLIMTSTDGIQWTRTSGPTNSGESYYLNAATYGNGVFVVGGWSRRTTTQGFVLVSSNLTTWIAGAEPSISIVNALAYGKNRFVAVGTGVARSTDGIAWTSSAAVIPGRLSGVTFGDDRFVAVGDPKLILSSSDGLDWTQHSTQVDGLFSVAYGEGSFVAVGDYFTDHPRGVAVQSGGRPQACLRALGFGSQFNSGFHLRLTAEHGRTYRLQSSPALPAETWTDVREVSLWPGYPDPVTLIDQTAQPVGQKFYRVISP